MVGVLLFVGLIGAVHYSLSESINITSFFTKQNSVEYVEKTQNYMTSPYLIQKISEPETKELEIINK